jgi:hypothetical protein
MNKTNEKVYMYILGAIIVIGFFSIIGIVFKLEMPQTNKDLGLIVIGALVAKFGDVVGYFYGSSKGSADKTELINK